MAVAAFAVHELRYLIAPPAASEAAEHAYIPFASGLVVLLFALAAGELALRVAGARDEGMGEAAPRAFWVAWLASSAGLAAIFTGQELAEAVLSGGPVVFPLAGGGLWALPLALALGALVALFLRLAGVAVSAALRRRTGRAPRPGVVAKPHWRPAPPIGSVLARHLAGRAPPLAS
jgi:hypothetical protein